MVAAFTPVLDAAPIKKLLVDDVLFATVNPVVCACWADDHRMVEVVVARIKL